MHVDFLNSEKWLSLVFERRNKENATRTEHSRSSRPALIVAQDGSVNHIDIY